jgi:hypothetical protein
MNITHIKSLATSLLLATTLSACGNDSTPTTTTTSTSITVNGQAIAGAVDGTVTVRDATGVQLATGTVSAGSFAVEIPNAKLNGELDFEVTGTYRDEVSGQSVTLTVNDPLSLRVAANQYQAGTLGNAPLTPDTSIIRAMVSNGMSITAAETAFQATFGYTPDLSASPFDPYTTQITTQTTADQTAAFRVGMFSQLGADLGLTAADLAELPNKFAADLADGTLDGIAGGNPVTFTSGINLQTMNQMISLTNRLSIAVSAFAGSAANVAGVAAPSMGLPPIVADAPGTIKQVTLTDGTNINIKLDAPYTAPFQMGFRNVKTTHQLTITDAATGAGIDITALGAKISAININPWMYMFTGHGHPTPIGTLVNTTPVSGIYTVDIYYLMPTGMMMGTEIVPMGQWDLNIALTDATGAAPVTTNAHFFPNVMMNMGTDLLLATGTNANDTWTDMTGVTKPREYRVWLQDIVTNVGGGHDFTIYATTLGMQMNVGMIFPPVYAGLMMPSIMTVTCEVSTDAGITWQAMPAGATNGQYSITSLTGLSNTTQNTLDIRLTVNGNVMTTVAGSNLQLKFIAL